jgi:hypothetical protein
VFRRIIVSTTGTTKTTTSAIKKMVSISLSFQQFESISAEERSPHTTQHLCEGSELELGSVLSNVFQPLSIVVADLPHICGCLVFSIVEILFIEDGIYAKVGFNILGGDV